MKNFIRLQLFFTVIVVITAGFINIQQPAWEVPAEYKTMKNPVKKTDQAIAEGKVSYDQNCASCHGLTGKGDGKKSEHLAKAPVDISLEHYQKDDEGVFFYKVKIGRSGLHSFKNKLDDNDIWSVLHYTRTFQK